MRFRIITEATILIGLTATGAAPPTQAPVPADVRAARFAAARSLHEELAAHAPAAPASAVWVARTPGWLRDASTAAATFDDEIDTHPTDVDALLGKAYLLTWAARDVEAAALLGRAAVAAPDRIDVHLARARHATLVGTLPEAETHLARALALDPTDPEARALRHVVTARRAGDSLRARLRRFLARRS